MSSSYIVCPVDDEILAHGQYCGTAISKVTEQGRFPTVEELTCILESIEGHTLKQPSRQPGFGMTIESEELVEIPANGPFCQHSCPVTCLHVQGNLSIDGNPRSFVMRGEMNLMLAFIRRLSEICGPQVFFYGGDGVPCFMMNRSETSVCQRAWPGFCLWIHQRFT